MFEYEVETLWCTECGDWWERRVVRGRKPSLCPSCKRVVQFVRNPNPRPKARPANLILNDGGKSDAGFKRETNDCTVRALAVACDVPYSEAYTFMAQNGRRKNKGSYFQQVIWRNNGEILGRTLVDDRTIKPAKGTKTAFLRNPQLRRGTWLVHMTHHVAVMKDGQLIDSFDSSRKVIDGAWKVL